jgi:siroheme synthase
MLGKVYLVGAGPRDPDLLTLKGKKCLEEAHTVLYDQLVSEALLETCSRKGRTDLRRQTSRQTLHQSKSYRRPSRLQST